jgi:5-methylcytosine-specific restriction protein A
LEFGERRSTAAAEQAMPLRETLQKILTEYPAAKGLPLEGHTLAAFIRHQAAQAVEEGLGGLGVGLVGVEGSPGQGNWAAVPWISVFDPAVTTSATRGYYVVYLFHASEPVVHLSLNQGTTSVREEFGAHAREILKDRAHLMRKRVAEYEVSLPVTSIELGSTARLPGDYVAGHALGASYALAALPEEAKLRTDLQTIVRAYRALTYRGGVDADVEAQTELGDEFNLPASTTVIETRKYAFHRKIERNRTAARQAKKFHGPVCHACDFDFGKRYGTIGKGFIEAHHLKPISTLEEGVAVHYDVAEDFAVLCSNCHRMIHRSADPSDLVAFRALVQSYKT